MGLVEATTYKVETLYVTNDEASKGLREIEGGARGAAEATHLLKHALEAVGIGLSIEKAKHAFIDFNAEVQNAKISLSTMLQGNYAVDWTTATDGANRLYTEFQRFSQLTPVTTQEMLEFGRGVTVATAQAGGSLRDVINVTDHDVENASVAFFIAGELSTFSITFSRWPAVSDLNSFSSIFAKPRICCANRMRRETLPISISVSSSDA